MKSVRGSAVEYGLSYVINSCEHDTPAVYHELCNSSSPLQETGEVRRFRTGPARYYSGSDITTRAQRCCGTLRDFCAVIKRKRPSMLLDVLSHSVRPCVPGTVYDMLCSMRPKVLDLHPPPHLVTFTWLASQDSTKGSTFGSDALTQMTTSAGTSAGHLPQRSWKAFLMTSNSSSRKIFERVSFDQAP
jgi:hypothetical protein